jgi:hypothetical protein
MVISKRSAAAAGVTAAVSLGLYEAGSSLARTRRAPRIPYVIVDGRGHRLSSLFTGAAPPPDQLAYFKKYSMRMGAVHANIACQAKPSGRIAAAWDSLARRVAAALSLATVHAQDCGLNQTVDTSCPTDGCEATYCYDVGPGCVDGSSGQPCSCPFAGCS